MSFPSSCSSGAGSSSEFCRWYSRVELPSNSHARMFLCESQHMYSYILKCVVDGEESVSKTPSMLGKVQIPNWPFMAGVSEFTSMAMKDGQRLQSPCERALY